MFTFRCQVQSESVALGALRVAAENPGTRGDEEGAVEVPEPELRVARAPMREEGRPAPKGDRKSFLFDLIAKENRDMAVVGKESCRHRCAGDESRAPCLVPKRGRSLSPGPAGLFSLDDSDK